MENTAPPAPALISPVNLSSVQQPLHFEWAPVSDPSGVTYLLQISQDSTFATTLANIGGLSEPFYDMLDTVLPSVGDDNPYYWRVIAVDGARNASLPSEVQSFTTGFSLDSLPPMLTFLVGTVSPILFVGIIYVIGRRIF
jgi:hypothetical protein